MITCTVGDLYDSIQLRGGLTARVYLETVESDRLIETIPIEEDVETLPQLPYAPTLPSPDTKRELTPTWRPDPTEDRRAA